MASHNALTKGAAIKLFSWGTPLEQTNRFDRIEVPRGTQWDFSRLYTTGEVTFLGYSPFQAGDSDKDYDFDPLDLVSVLQAGKYQTGAEADWREGDWDENGVFDERDIVMALQTGNYLQDSYATDEVFAADEPLLPALR